MWKPLVYALSYLNLATLLLPLGVGFYYRRYLTTPLWLSWLALLAYFLLFALSLSQVLKLHPVNTHLIKYLISGTFGGLFVLAYWWLLPPGWRRALVAGLGLFGLIALATEALGQGGAGHGMQWAVLAQTIVNTVVLLLYWPLLLRQTRSSLLNVPIFWISTGLLISLVLGTLYDAFYPLMLTSSINLLLGVLCFQLSVTCFCNGLYAMGFYKAGVR